MSYKGSAGATLTSLLDSFGMKPEETRWPCTCEPLALEDSVEAVLGVILVHFLTLKWRTLESPSRELTANCGSF